MEIRTKNRFGHRFITHKEFLAYGKDLDLFVDHPNERLLEFFERNGSLNPVARIRFPPSVVRRWHRERYPDAAVPDPVEGDTQLLAHANQLHNDVFNNSWRRPDIHGEGPHPLDEVAPEHALFVQTSFDPSSFVPWTQHRTPIEVRDGAEMHDSASYARTCYHYWQVFPLAALLRSGVTILYDLNNDALAEAVYNLAIGEERRQVRVTMNLEARHELRRIAEQASMFNAVAWFAAYRHNALQVHIRYRNQQTGKLPYDRWRTYLRRQRELAGETAQRFEFDAERLLAFIKFQCELWCTAKARSPERLAEEYARNIHVSIDLYRAITRAEGDEVVRRVGRAGGYFKPILKVIFPDWLDDQRDLAERSLLRWAQALSSLPPPFAVAESDIPAFCTWLEQSGLYQLYWHFRRFVDLGSDDEEVSLVAAASEVTSYANTVELMANAIIEERSGIARGHTLAVKVREIVKSAEPSLEQLLIDYKKLTKTETSTLGRRLAQIDRLRRGGPHAPIVRALLKLTVIRNEGSHLGLAGFDQQKIYSLLEALVQASLLLWKAR